MSDIIHLLNQHSSRRLIDEIVDFIGDDSAVFDQVLALSFSESYPVNMRASWAIVHFCDKNPHFIQPHLDEIVLKLNPNMVAGLKRNYIKVFATHAKLNQMEQLGRLIDFCFTLFNDPAETIAVRAFSLDVLLKVGKTEPDLIPEIIETILFHKEHFSAGLQNKAKKVIAKLEK